MPPAKLLQEIDLEFQKRYGHAPEWVAAAPGRVNLIGEHVDYNDGWALPFAIDRSTAIAASRAAPGSATELQSMSRDRPVRVAEFRSLPGGGDDWANYVIGVMALGEQLFGPLPALQILVHSDLPSGAGLSSSAALTVATATLLEGVMGSRISGLKKAELCQRAEGLFAGVPCGLMDPYTSVHGITDHLLWLDCRVPSHRLIPFNSSELGLLVVDSQVRHSLADGAYAERRDQCYSAAEKLGVDSLREAFVRSEQLPWKRLTEVEQRRARHVISELDRTEQMVSALRRSDWARAGRLLYESHESLRDNYEVSCVELDVLVDAAQRRGAESGIWGARMTGGGFGGCLLALTRRDAVTTAARGLVDDYLAATGRSATWWEVHPSAGAALLRGATD